MPRRSRPPQPLEVPSRVWSRDCCNLRGNDLAIPVPGDVKQPVAALSESPSPIEGGRLDRSLQEHQAHDTGASGTRGAIAASGTSALPFSRCQAGVPRGRRGDRIIDSFRLEGTFKIKSNS